MLSCPWFTYEQSDPEVVVHTPAGVSRSALAGVKVTIINE